MNEIEVKTAEDMTDAVCLFLKIAPPVERARFGAFVVGFAKALTANIETEEEDHDDRSRS